MSKYPNIRHHLCYWHLLSNMRKQLGANQDELLGEFSNISREYTTISDFESKFKTWKAKLSVMICVSSLIMYYSI